MFLESVCQLINTLSPSNIGFTAKYECVDSVSLSLVQVLREEDLNCVVEVRRIPRINLPLGHIPLSNFFH